MSELPSFAKFVPGFDFLQGLVKNAGQTLPGIGQWVAPTLNPEELQKRIDELRTVQYWLEQNARMLATTIQALEVQRMTLSTLKTMNVPLADLQGSLKLPETPTWPGLPAEMLNAATQAATQAASQMAAAAMPMGKAAASAAATAATGAAAKVAKQAAAKVARKAAPKAKPSAPEAPATPPLAVDPTLWWTALSQQFAQLAASAMKDSAADAAKNLAGNLVKQGIDAAGDTLRKAASVPGTMVGNVAKGLAAGTRPAATKKSVRTPTKKSSG
jgi:hypothetical protein